MTNNISNSNNAINNLEAYIASNSDIKIVSNVAEVQIINNEVSVYKYASSKAVVSGETITYTIEIKNDGTFVNTNLFFKDTLPNSVTFIEGSVKIDGVSQIELSPVTGFSLRDLNANDKILIEFNVVVK